MHRAAVTAFLLLAPAGAALAQAVGVPPIEQEPRPGAVQQREQALGIVPSQRQERRETQEVDRLYQELTGQNPASTAPAPIPPPLATPQQDARGTDQIYQQLMGQSPNAPVRGPVPQMGPPLSSQAGSVDQLYRDMTGQNPNASR